MAAGKLTISIDLELAWGVWDHLTPDDLRLIESAERPICAALIELFDRHQVPATWAVVAALLDEVSAATQPGPRACWFAPDIVEDSRQEQGPPRNRQPQRAPHLFRRSERRRGARGSRIRQSRAPRARPRLRTRSCFRAARPAISTSWPSAGLKVCNHADVGWVESARRLGRPCRTDRQSHRQTLADPSSLPPPSSGAAN